jgi:hypothetical protein
VWNGISRSGSPSRSQCFWKLYLRFLPQSYIHGGWSQHKMLGWLPSWPMNLECQNSLLGSFSTGTLIVLGEPLSVTKLWKTNHISHWPPNI